MHKTCTRVGWGNRKELRTEFAGWKSSSSLRKQGPGDARRKRRDGRGRSKGKQEEQGKRSGKEEEKRRRGRGRRGGEPCHFADNNPSLTVGVKQQCKVPAVY